jgi:hypothetical protein
MLDEKDPESCEDVPQAVATSHKKIRGSTKKAYYLTIAQIIATLWNRLYKEGEEDDPQKDGYFGCLSDTLGFLILFSKDGPWQTRFKSCELMNHFAKFHGVNIDLNNKNIELRGWDSMPIELLELYHECLLIVVE